MASCSPRKTDENGRILTWQRKVSRGRDKVTGKQLTPHTTTFTRPDGWSDNKTLKELRRVMGEYEAACKRGEVQTKEEQAEQARREQVKPTFTSYVESYLTEKAAVLAPVTLSNYRRILNKAIPALGSMRIEDITIVDIKRYISDLQLNGKNEHSGKPLAHGTITAHYLALHAFFLNAVENEVITVHPMQNMKPPKPSKEAAETKEQVVYNEEQARYIIKCLDNEPLKWKAFVIFMLDSGCRNGEVVGLKWDAINFTNGEVKIRLNAQYASGKGIYLSTPKNRKNRTITLNPPALAVMREWRREQAETFLAMGIQVSGFCFTREDGSMINPGSPKDFFDRFGKKYELPGIHPHAMRHTCASLMIAGGADVASVSAKLGHSSPSITLDIYTHVNEKAQQKANAILADAIYKDMKEA